MANEFDIIFLGAGLANCLSALRIQSIAPHLKLALIEREAAIGGNCGHTWSFHLTDVVAENSFENHWLRPLVSRVWDASQSEGYEVSFPGFRRRLPLAYASCRSDEFNARFMTLFRGVVRFFGEVQEVRERSVVWLDKVSHATQRWTGRLICDGRGVPSPWPGPCGYQKFLGLNLRLAAPHGLEAPIIMDACVPQRDGFRFVYVLPFADRDLLVEDTYYSNSPTLDEVLLRDHILSYAQARGWVVEKIISSERGVLPIPLHQPGVPELLRSQAEDCWAVKLGMAGGYFHPVTGYSLVSAVKVAEVFADLVHKWGIDRSERVAMHMSENRRLNWKAGSFLRRLNTMLFLAGPTQERYKVLEKFYRHDARMIERFYGNRLNFLDRVRLLSGRPPVPVMEALRVLARRQNLSI